MDYQDEEEPPVECQNKSKRDNQISTRDSTSSPIAQTSSSSGFSSSLESLNSQTTAEIFYVYDPIKIANGVKIDGKETNKEKWWKKADGKSNSPLPGTYVKHGNTDTQRLPLRHRLRLLRIHYFRCNNLVRTLFVLVCFMWFVFNAFIILNQFLLFDTIVYMEYQSPKQSMPPAITLCTHCIYCSSNLHKIQNLYVDDVIQNDYQWNENKPPLKFGHQDLNSSIHKPNSYYIDFDDIVLQCVLVANTVNLQFNNEPNLKPEVYNCTDVAKVVVSMQEGHKCFTLFSDIFGEMSKHQSEQRQKYQLEFEKFPKIQLSLANKYLVEQSPVKKNTYNKSLIMNKSSAGMYMVLHSPTILPNMLELSLHRISAGRLTGMRFVKKIENLQPWPYQTNCFPYDSKRLTTPEQLERDALRSANPLTSAGLDLYRSQGECFVYCMWRLLNRKGCVNFYSIFTQNVVYQEELIRQELFLRNQLSKIEQNHGKHGDQSAHFAFNQTHLNPDDDTGTARLVDYFLKFCPVDSLSFARYMLKRKICLKACNKACHVETFSIENIVELSYIDDSFSVVDIEWDTQPVIFISHHEKVSVYKFLGNIGGHAHIWLGISVIHIFRYIVHQLESGRFIRFATATSGCCLNHWFRLIYSRKRNLV